jgi:DNA-binding LacI/PurR family transcriptional regulator
LGEAQRDGRQVAAGIIRFSALEAWTRDPRLIAEPLRRPEAPTGIVAWNDQEALRLIAVLRQAGLRVPEDLSVIGYDALPQGTLVHPALTTVDHGVGQQLHAAIALLTRPTAPSANHTVLMVPTLVVRGSTAAPAR